ncbi:MAG TPA: IS5 family transposase [Candidatus Acidoferrales bacterium]|nr:IS5 family transposase [Candidatus Acidoferrales bacterium]
MDLTEAQWKKLKPLLVPKRRPDGRGRPWRDTRTVLNGILWVLRTGAPWHDLPDRYPPYQTCHRRFQQWQRDGTLTRLLHALAEDLRARGKLDLSETFIDASFSSAKKGAPAVGPTRRGKGSKIMAIADRHGLPVACGVASASPHETKLVEATVQQRFTRAKPKRMIGDRAYDSDPLDQRLRQKYRIRLIAPHKWNRRRPSTQDGRDLRRYCRRWKIERLFAWLHNFRRLVSRWEYHEANFLGMLQLGCLIILLRHL